MFRADARAEAWVKRMPSLAARPMATVMAVGVASPMAQGQAMTMVAMVVRSAGCQLPVMRSQAVKLRAARRRMMGTKMAATRSARDWIWVLPAWALLTSSMIVATVLVAAVEVAR